MTFEHGATVIVNDTSLANMRMFENLTDIVYSLRNIYESTYEESANKDSLICVNKSR